MHTLFLFFLQCLRFQKKKKQAGVAVMTTVFGHDN